MSRTRMTAIAACAAVLPATAAGAAVEPPRPAFYEAPAYVAGAAGDVLRSELMTFAVDPAGLSNLVMTSTRVLYVSTDRTGAKIAVSGTVLVPKTPWIGVGKRPIIGYAAGTQGLADRCAPSRMQSEGLEYESLFIKASSTGGMPSPSPTIRGSAPPECTPT